ncbi:uncharacterized protein [Dermacentor andersoni]|uniref:uncharacterized protein n=1 Tax=Dermacentor andersoni TaxID=34620 RepID=UPI00215501BB|nr:uncharacterized protein LOC126539680 [Dermacentor andersoni]
MKTATRYASTAQLDVNAPVSILVPYYAVKVPPYSHQPPDIVLLRVDARFQVAHITSQQPLYTHVLAAVPRDIVLRVRDLTAPQSTMPCDTLKAAMLERTVLHKRRRLRQHLSTTLLADRQPSQLLRHMQHLLGSQTSTIHQAQLKHLFVGCVFITVQMMLLHAPKRSLSALACWAEKTARCHVETSLLPQ